MNDKYYTPQIEEFHVGFEYEGFITDFGVSQWSENEFTLSDAKEIDSFYSTISKQVSAYDNLRVKILDREDIESLGFIFVGEDEDELEFRGSKNEELYFNPDTLKIIIYETPNMDCVFRGKIKNKSELKRLLTQLEL